MSAPLYGCFGIVFSMDPNSLIFTDSEEEEEAGSSEEYSPSQSDKMEAEKELAENEALLRNKKTAKKRVHNDQNESNPESVDLSGSSPKETPSKKTKTTLKKKEIEFEEKRRVAEEVSKHMNIYDICNASYSDKQLESATWRKIAESTGLDIDVCKRHWNSLRHSANYYASEKKIPYKSGADADDPILEEKYRSDWQYKDTMSFYTPPKKRSASSTVSITNTSASLSESFASTFDLTPDDTLSVYVSI